MRDTFSRLGAGRLAYVVWHAPLGRFRKCIAEGGPVEQWRTERGRRAMQEAARHLPPPDGAGDPVELHVLTGRRFWYQTAFCLWSFAQHSGRPLAPIVYDDGTVDAAMMATLRQIFPRARFVRQSDTLARLDALLPRSQYPNLRERWAAYPNIRKLTDVHAGSAGWKLVLDSDLLFFRRPHQLLDWLIAPSIPLVGVDCVESYGYDRGLLEGLAGAPLPPAINVGICGLKSDAINWDEIERWISELHRRQGTHYYLEQAIVAMLLARQPFIAAPATDYRTNPRPDDTRSGSAIMHHYVADSKTAYFRHEWQRAVAAAHVARS